MPLFHFDNMLRLTGSARQNLPVSSGDFVSVTVLKQLGPEKWAVGIKGKVFPAVSTVPLTAGSTIFAQVQAQGRTIMLKLANEMPPQPQAHLAQARLVLEKLGLPHDPATLLVVSSMMKSSLPISEKLVAKMRNALMQMKGDREKNARILALCVEKGISPDSPGIQELAELIDQDAGNGENRGRKKSREQAPEASENEEILYGDISPISVFNHLPGHEGNWVVVPFETDLSGKTRKGTLRVLYDVYSRKPKRIVIAPDGSDGGRMFFVLQPSSKGMRCSIFTDKKARLQFTPAQMEEFRLKMSNLKVKTDDIIHEDVYFDGFDQDIEDIPIQSIDTQG